MGTKEQLKAWETEQNAIEETLTNNFSVDFDKYERIFLLDMKIKGFKI